MVFEQVCTDLEGEGYQVQTYVLSASSQNAPHLRYRCWIVGIMADTNNTGDRTSRSRTDENREKEVKGWEEQPQSEPSRHSKDVADTSNWRGEQTEWQRGEGVGRGSFDIGRFKTKGQKDKQNVANSDSERQQEQWRAKSTQENYDSIKCKSWWSVEPSVGRVAHGIPNRVDRLKGLGNAVVPQIPAVLGRAILEVHNG